MCQCSHIGCGEPQHRQSALDLQEQGPGQDSSNSLVGAGHAVGCGRRSAPDRQIPVLQGQLCRGRCVHMSLPCSPAWTSKASQRLCNWMTQFTGFISANDTPVAVLQSSDLIHSYCVAKKSHADSLNAATRHISPYATLDCSFECPLHYLGQSQRPGRSSSCMPA